MAKQVEIIQVYDGDYYYVFVDGKPAPVDNNGYHQIYKEDWAKVIIKSKTQQLIANSVGVKPEDLLYSFYNIYYPMVEFDDDNFSSDDYESYAVTAKAIAEHKIKPDFYQENIAYIENNY